GQRRFSAMVLVDAIHVKGVPAAAGAVGINLDVEIVPTEEPVKGELRLLVPPPVGCGAIRFKTGRDRCLRLDGLLVEISPCLAARIKPIVADWPEIAALGSLDFRQPAERFQTAVQDRLLSSGPPGGNEGVSQLGVVISERSLEPSPVGCGRAVE